jgi:hypothetical protein
MKKSAYQIARVELKMAAIEAKNYFKSDKPAINQSINDSLDSICRSVQLSEYQRNLLANYACTLHPKN